MTGSSFDRPQYRLLLALLRTLGSRRELTGQFGLNAPAVGIIAGFCLLMGAVVALVVASAQPAARDVLMLCQGMTTLVLVPLLVSEAADALLNPAEVSVLAHRPVGNLTYLAAKVTYVVGFSVTLAAALNLLPAVAGLWLAGTRWFYPVTHLAAATLGAVVTALATCGVFGVFFRLIPVARVRSAALWVQLLGASVAPLLPYLSRGVSVDVDFDAPIWSAAPVTWFAAVGLLGQAGGPHLDMAFALPAMAVAAGLVTIGFRALSRQYMTRISAVISSGRPPRAGVRPGGLYLPLRLLTHSQATYGAARFVLQMGLRDWQFRRGLMRSAVLLVMLVPLALRDGLRSPFDAPGFAVAHLLPHIFGITLVASTDFLPFSDHYKARWTFLTMPASALQGVVGGSLIALWFGGALLPSLLTLAVTSVIWTFGAAVLFAGYTLAVTSFYLGISVWLISGLPFTRAPDPARAAGNFAGMIGFVIIGVILGAIQAIFLFPHAVRVAGATVAFGTCAWIAIRISVRLLENRVPELLSAFVPGRIRLFDTGTHEEAD